MVDIHASPSIVYRFSFENYTLTSDKRMNFNIEFLFNGYHYVLQATQHMSPFFSLDRNHRISTSQSGIIDFAHVLGMFGLIPEDGQVFIYGITFFAAAYDHPGTVINFEQLFFESTR